MSAWKEPQLPRPQRPRPPVAKNKKPSMLARGLAAVAAAIFGFTACLNLYSAVTDKSGNGDPFMALAILLPAGILFRYALTGQIKMN
jgi:hypothetical protein